MPDQTILAVLEHKITSMHSDMGEVRNVLKELTAAINRLALVEERQSQLSLTLERAFKVLDRIEERAEVDRKDVRNEIAKLDTRVNILEVAEPMQKQTSKWVIAGITGLVALMATTIVPRLLHLLMGV